MDYRHPTPEFPSLLGDACLEDLAALATAAPPGHFAEFGVYKGGAARVLYDIAEATGRRLFLFDTFAGHTVVDEAKDAPAAHWPGRYAENAEHEDALRRVMPNAVIVKGTVPDTLTPDLLAAMAPLGFVHCDMDLYWPTKAVCEVVYPLLTPGAGILFDDYPFAMECPGVRQAVDETLGRVGLRPFTGRAWAVRP